MPSSPVAFKKQHDDEVCVHLIGHSSSIQCCTTPDDSSTGAAVNSKMCFDYSRYYPVLVKSKQTGIKCPNWSQVATYTPAVILLISLIEIVVYSQTDENIRKRLNFDPKHKEEAYRFITYMLVHINKIHLLLNVLIQCILGTPLEVEQGSLRTAAIYLGGGVGGALGSSVVESTIVIEGASAGVYAILMAQIPHIILNFRDLRFKLQRCLVVVILLAADISHVVFHIYTSGNECPRISLSAHAFGALSGIFLGLALFHGTSKWTKTYQILATAISCILWSAAIIHNAFRAQE